MAQTRPKGPEAIGKWQPGLAVAEIQGQPIAAQQASVIIVAATPEGQKALLAKKRAQYKIQVRDADFFSDAP